MTNRIAELQAEVKSLQLNWDACVEHAKRMEASRDRQMAKAEAAETEVERLHKIIRSTEKKIAARRYRSGCCCDIGDDGETIIKWCAVHVEFKDRAEVAEADLAAIVEEHNEFRDRVLELRSERDEALAVVEAAQRVWVTYLARQAAIDRADHMAAWFANEKALDKLYEILAAHDGGAG